MPTSSTVRRRLLVTVLAASTGCAGATAPHDDGGTQVPAVDALPRSLTGDERSTIAAANAFSLALFRTVSAAQKDQNVFMSPLSASMALGMVTNGASGATYDQMVAALAYAGGTSQDQINGGYKKLVELLRGLDPAVKLGVANSVWYRKEFPVHRAFLDVVTAAFDARVTGLDFGSPASVVTINGWVSDATAGRIPSIIDGIDPMDVMFLINAIYFKGSWRTRFDPAQTRAAPFHGVGGDRTVQSMRRVGNVRYFATPDLQAAELPYGNNAFNMIVLLPTAGRSVEALAATLQANKSLLSTDQFHETEIEFGMPRFKLEWERILNDDLKALGLRDAFMPAVADFSRMSPRGRDLYVAFVKQKTFVEVNEEGTEAAAVTNIGMRTISVPIRPVMVVDRPFIVVIGERLSGTVLFMGKIVRL